MKQNQVRRESNQLVFGIRAVMEAVKSGKDIEAIYVQHGLTGEIFHEFRNLLRERGLTFQQVPAEKLNRMTRKNHQGVIGIVSAISYQKIEDIIPAVYEKGEVPLILILDGITDVRNLGAIARTAECAGVHALVVPSRGSAQINADAIKTSAGALFNIPVCRHEHIQRTARFLQESGLQLIACTEKTNTLIYETDYTVPAAVILGSEEDGVSPELIRIADHLGKIPMFGEIESLNVSVSAGVVLYEIVRQRRL